MTGLTETVARFAVDPPFGEAPKETLPIIRAGFIDTIATMMAGRDEPVTRIVRAHVKSRGNGASEASLLFGDERAPAEAAALVNGTAGHALDYDDVALAGHPSTVLVPAILAEGERSRASGRDALRAYLVGYEVWAELLAREPDAYHIKGWHPTAVLGCVGAAAAIASLRRVDAAVARHAIALSASFAGGLVANFGTMTKPFHAGRAAAAGIEAVHLAEAGMTASPDALEHPAGFLAALSPNGRVDLKSPANTLGHTLRLLERGLSFKKYPMCYGTHRVIDAVLDLARREDIRAESVRRANATIGIAQASMLRNHAPVTGLEAKFSLEFAIASALVARRVGLAELTDEFVNQQAVRDAMTKVAIRTTDTLCPVEPPFAYSDRVEIELEDGRKIDSGEVRFARGHAKLPLKDEELEQKFRDCCRGANHIDAGRLFGALMALESQPRLGALAA